MAATEATVGTSAGASEKTPVATAASSCDADEVAEKEEPKSESTVSEGTASNLVNSGGKSHSNELKLTSSKTSEQLKESPSPEQKSTAKDKISEANVGKNCVKSDGTGVIGQTISCNLGTNERDKPKNSVAVKANETSSVPPDAGKNKGAGSSSESTDKPPHSTEKLLQNAVVLVDQGKPVTSPTCPPGAPIDSLSADHQGAASLNITTDTNSAQRTGNCVDGEEPIEQELQPLSKPSGQSEREGLCCQKNGKLLKNYGSLDSSVGMTISSPEEEISPNSSSTTQAPEGTSVGGEAPDEPTKKKKKRKKKKKGTSEAEAGGAASLSDHESKALTSPGTSGTEDSSKPPAFDSQAQLSQKQKGQTPLNGPSATQSKPNVTNKNRKSENKSENSSSGSKKQSNHMSKSIENPSDDNRLVTKSEKVSSKSSVKADRPKSLDFSNKIDAVRTIPQQSSTGHKLVKSDSDGQAKKVEHVSDNDSDSGNEAEKSSEDTSVKASQESSVDETFQDDESNGDGWQVSGQKKNKRRAMAAEDRYPFRQSPAEHLRRHYYSGPFDPRLRKSSSEPSGMSKWMDDSRTVFRHSSFSRHQYLREEFHSLSPKPESSDSVEKPSLSESVPEPVPEPANSYAAKLKAKPPVAPIKKSPDNPSVTGGVPEGGSGKVEDNKPLGSDPTSQVSGDQKISPGASSETDSRSEAKSSTSSQSIAESKAIMESDSEFDDTAGKGQVSGIVSAATAAKSASLPRDMGRNPGTELAKLDNTSADNIVQYLDLQCSNDTYAARLKQSINKAADSKAGSRTSSNKPEKVVTDESAKPPRTSKLESSHKAVSLDSAQPIPPVVPKKASSASSKDKESMRTVKSETSLNLTSEGAPAIQDNSFPFEAQPAATFDITFGSVKFSESDFELIDDVAHGSGQQSKVESNAKTVPPPTNVENAKTLSGAKMPPPPANHVSCADLEKEWINKGLGAASAPSDGSIKTSEPTSAPAVHRGLAALLAKSVNKMGDNNNMSKKSAEHTFQTQIWSARFNHSELANMLLADWESSNCELIKQSSNVVIYEEE